MPTVTDSLKIGDKLDIQGPFGHIEYMGKGIFNHSRKEMPQVKEVRYLPVCAYQ